MNCRSCGNKIEKPFMDFGRLPLPNTFTEPGSGGDVAKFPLAVYFCPVCTLAQLDTQLPPEDIFNDGYKYFSSYSSDLLAKSKLLFENTVSEFGLTRESRIIEIASNDGYLLNFFREGGFGNILGVEPTLSTAKKAIEKGIPTEICFFGEEVAKRLAGCVGCAAGASAEAGAGLAAGTGKADIIIANNVLAHVPDINGFVSGISTLLKDSGTAIIEFQYVRDLILLRLFDLIYHEHYSYFSLRSANELMKRNGLKIFRVEKTSSQGGSLRIFCAKEGSDRDTGESFRECMAEEERAQLHVEGTYLRFADDVKAKKKECAEYLSNLKRGGQGTGKSCKIAAYGASAKGSIFLNYLGIDNSVIDFIADKNINKQNMILAGSGIPVYSPEMLARQKPDYVLILSWNLRDEIVSQNPGMNFIVLQPKPEIIYSERIDVIKYEKQ